MDNYNYYYPKYGRNILIIGAGIVGGATGMGFKDHNVAFVDISEQVISNLTANGFKAYHPSNIPEEAYDFVFVCLPTPYDYNRNEQNMSIVKSSVSMLKKIIENSIKPTIVLRSTILPGTSRSIINSLERMNVKEGKDFYFCVNPEFLRSKSALEDFMNPWAIVIGADNNTAADNLTLLYKDFIEESKIYRVSLEEAELIKYVHNFFNAAKISFANQIWFIARKFGIDGNKIMSIVSETAEGSWNKRYGIKGGIPYGGYCLPKDTKGFLAWLKSNDISAPLLEAVDEINDSIKIKAPLLN